MSSISRVVILAQLIELDEFWKMPEVNGDKNFKIDEANYGKNFVKVLYVSRNGEKFKNLKIYSI